MEGDDHVTNAEFNRFVNQSCAALHGIMVDFDEAYFIDKHTYTTTPGVDNVPLAWVSDPDQSQPFSPYKILHVSANINGWERSLDRWTFEKLTLYTNASTWGVQALPISYRYHVNQVGTTSLLLSPVPDGVYPITVYYVESFVDLVADDDKYWSGDGWEEWVVLDAAIKALTKEESSITDLTAERDRVLVRIQAQMRTPDLDHPGTVRDTENAGYGRDWMQVRS
jgi:hypothetical protein